MKKRNKKYRPKLVMRDPITYVVNGTKKVSEEHQQNLAIKHSMAMTKFLQGNGDKSDFDIILGCVNMSLCMTEMFFNDNHRQTFLNGKAALKSLGERYYKLNKFVLNGDEIKALNLCIQVCEEYMRNLLVKEVEMAINEVQRRLDNKINVEKIKRAA